MPHADVKQGGFFYKFQPFFTILIEKNLLVVTAESSSLSNFQNNGNRPHSSLYTAFLGLLCLNKLQLSWPTGTKKVRYKLKHILSYSYSYLR